MENNNAFVCVLKNINKIEGKDRIVKADITLNSVCISEAVVGVDSKDGDLVVFFDSNMCLKPSILDLNPEMGKYLLKGGRVKAQKFSGILSTGLCIPIDKFYSFFKSKKEATSTLGEGYSFNFIDGVEICSKYTPPAPKHTPQANKKKPKKDKTVKIVEGGFPLHKDTEQLLRNMYKINPSDSIEVSRKVHGTSARIARTLVHKKLSFIDKVAKYLGVNVKDTEFVYAYGSRTVTKQVEISDFNKNLKHFYGSDIWTDAGNRFFKGKLKEGEHIFYEVCGYMPRGGAIQKMGKAVYSYGCSTNDYRVYVYRIAYMTQNGKLMELSVPEYRLRCEELGVEAVTQYYNGIAKDKYPEIKIDDDWHKNFVVKLKEDYLDKPATDCVGGAWDEGVVVRKSYGAIEAFKLKSPKFILGESAAVEKDEITDTEEQ